jgi:glycosyltransferase involved in cell wall biosynthesis
LELEARIHDLDLQGVHLVGYLPPQEGWRRMADFDLGLAVLEPIPNYLESYPTKVFEYMSLGIPPIVSDFPLYRRIVAKHRCGVLVDPLDAEAIARAIIRLKENPAEAAEMGARGRKAASEFYSWESEQAKLLRFYRGLLSAS